MKTWCTSNLPLLIGRPELIPVQFNSKNYKRWKSSKYDKKLLNHINSVWHEIEVRNFLITFIFTHFTETEDDDKINLYIDCLKVLCLDMYVDFDIIRILLQKNKIKVNGYSEIFNRIRDIRSHIKIHREKDDFYLAKGTSWTSYDDGTDFSILITDKFGNERFMKVSPLKDAKLLIEILDKIFSE